MSRRRLAQGVAALTVGAGLSHARSARAAAIPDSVAEWREELHQGGQAGGQAIYLIGQEGAHLVPSFSSFSTVIEPTVPFFDGLTRPGKDREPTPSLAKDWTISDDLLHYTFNLRDDVTWHDGEPFSANDVKFTWETIAHPDNTTAAQLFNFFSAIKGAPEYRKGDADAIAGVTVVDPHTISVELTEPWTPFLTIGASQYIIPKHILGEIPVANMLESDYARAPIGTGPFVFQSWNAGDAIIGTANEHYFNGRPVLDQVVLKVAGLEGNTLITALLAGELNAAELGLEEIDGIGDDPAVVIRSAAGQNNQYIEFNFKSDFFHDLNVRKALSYALNRQAIVDLAWQGRAKVYNSVFPYDWWPTKQDTTIFDNDPEQAKQLLDEAGWTVGANGIREKDGKPFSFTMYSLSGSHWLIVQQQWKEIGVDAQIETVDFPTLASQYYTTKIFDAVALTIPYGLYTDPHYSLPGYFLSANNRNSYNNPKSDELILAAAAASDQDERKKLYYEWQEVIANDVPHLWIGNPETGIAYSAGLTSPERTSSYFEWREIHDWAWQ